MQPTLFDLYAAAALQGLVAHDGTHGEMRAKQACDCAQAMLDERAKRVVENTISSAFEYYGNPDDPNDD